MSKAIANVSAALGYDTECTMLAAGASLASVYAFAASREPTGVRVDTKDEGPASARLTAFADLADLRETLIPGKYRY